MSTRTIPDRDAPARERLDLESLRRVPKELAPPLDPAELECGILHVGLGAFHRAHQAIFTEDAMARSGARTWAVCGVSPRGSQAAAELRRQDGLYSVLERDAAASSIRTVGVLRGVLSAVDERDEVTARFASPAIRIVTLTVTENGYADGSGVVPLLRGGMAARRRSGAGAVTIVSCDNIPENGPFVRAKLLASCGDDVALASWIEENVAFPSCLVDRIVPAQQPQDVADASSRLGLLDRCAVACEPFNQWVIEDDFAAGRPAWEDAGVVLTDDASPYQLVKLRVLNGTHSALAYLGALAGHELIADAIGDDVLARYADRLIATEIVPTLAVPDGLDLAAYAASVEGRFANRALGHRCVQVASDGSQKLPLRTLPVVRALLAAGAEAPLALLVIAAWMRYVTVRRSERGVDLPVADALADTFLSCTENARGAGEVVERLLGIESVFGRDLVATPSVRSTLTGWLESLERRGVRATVLEALGADV